MKPLLNLVLAGICAASFTACGPNSKEGAVVGGLIGAGAGAIIGHQSGRGLEGAAIGGAAGAGTGALIGGAKDDREELRREDSERRAYEAGYQDSRQDQGYGNKGYDNRGGYDNRRSGYGSGY